MAKNNDLLDQFIDMLAEAVAERIGNTGPADDTPAPKKGRGKKAADPEPVEEEIEDEEEDEEEGSDFDRDARTAELKKKQIKSLRKIASDMGFDEEEVSSANKATLVTSIVDAEAEDAGEEPEDEEPEDEDDEGDELTRDDLEEMNLTALKAHAKSEEGGNHKAAALKGLDKESIIDLILGEEEEGDEDDDDDDEDGDEEEWYSRDELDEMSDAELKALCKDNGIKVPRGAKHKALVDLLDE